MSPPLRGTIDVKELRNTKTGKQYCFLKIAGETYSSWDLPKMATLNQGDTVEFSFEQRDGSSFKNISFITKARPEPSVKDAQIARAVALKAATELVSRLGGSAESRPNSADHRKALAAEVTDIASIFDSFLQESGSEEDHPPEPGEPEVE